MEDEKDLDQEQETEEMNESEVDKKGVRKDE